MSGIDIMQDIYAGLKQEPAQTGGDSRFADAIYALYQEFRENYRQEWQRLANNEDMFQGNHWHDVPAKDPNEPRPVTPIIFSTIENIRADLTDEYPEAVIRPEGYSDEVLAKCLTKAVEQVLESTDYSAEYDALTHDILVGGYCVQEVGYDPTLNFGLGGEFIRHISNANILFDPLCADIQDGRAVFKIDRRPNAWLRQHYPDQYARMRGTEELAPPGHFDFGPVRDPDGQNKYVVLIEAWIRIYDRETNRYAVHMVQLAGGQVLENSYPARPAGYYAHGLYPFVVTPLYKVKGSALGLGIVDMFRQPQLYSDKVDQIILKNAITAGRNKLLVQEGAANLEDLADYAKEVVSVANLNGVAWFQDRPLPGYILNYMMSIRQAIKEESGSNDFSRGNTTSGVTAASAITALQDMSSKRSRMEARAIHYGFRGAVRMLIEVMRDMGKDRLLDITLDGKPEKVSLRRVLAERAPEQTPVEFNISIKPVRETKFTKMANNELVLQFCSMFQGQLDPVILMEAMEFSGQELVLEKLRAAQGEGVAALQQQLGQAEAALESLSKKNEAQHKALMQMQAALSEQPANALS